MESTLNLGQGASNNGLAGHEGSSSGGQSSLALVPVHHDDGAGPVVPTKRLPSRRRRIYTAQEGADGDKKAFVCNYCQRVFPSSQALGGHQNAHKQERAVTKQQQGIDHGFTALGNPPFSFLSAALAGRVPPEALYRSSLGHFSSLGVRHDSTIHKPKPYTNPISLSGYHFGGVGLSGVNPQQTTSIVIRSVGLNGFGVLDQQLLSTGGLNGFRTTARNNQMARPEEVIKQKKPGTPKVDTPGIDLTLRLGI